MERKDERRKDSEDLSYDPVYAPAQHAWENFTGAGTSCYLSIHPENENAVNQLIRNDVITCLSVQ